MPLSSLSSRKSARFQLSTDFETHASHALLRPFSYPSLSLDRPKARLENTLQILAGLCRPVPHFSIRLFPSIHSRAKGRKFACPLLPKQSTAFYWRYNLLQESATSLAKNSRQHRSRILRARTLLGDTYFPVQPHPHCHLYLDAER